MDCNPKNVRLTFFPVLAFPLSKWFRTARDLFLLQVLADFFLLGR